MGEFTQLVDLLNAARASLRRLTLIRRCSGSLK